MDVASCASGNLIQLSDFGFLRLVDDGEDARDRLSDSADSGQLRRRSGARHFGHAQVVELESTVKDSYTFILIKLNNKLNKNLLFMLVQLLQEFVLGLSAKFAGLDLGHSESVTSLNSNHREIINYK